MCQERIRVMFKRKNKTEEWTLPENGEYLRKDDAREQFTELLRMYKTLKKSLITSLDPILNIDEREDKLAEIDVECAEMALDFDDIHTINCNFVDPDTEE